MRFYDVPVAALEEIAAGLDFEFRGEDESNSRGPRARGVIRPTPGMDRYRKISLSMLPYTGKTRRIHAVCWHGHREFLRAVFREYPDARVSTRLADYRGSAGFEAVFPETGTRNVGSAMYPVRADETCNCYADRLDVDTGAPEPEHEVTFGRLTPTGLEDVRTIRQAEILACPHVILVPEHYREDGSCRCLDPTHEEMSEWGYVWKDGAWRSPAAA